MRISRPSKPLSSRLLKIPLPLLPPRTTNFSASEVEMTLISVAEVKADKPEEELVLKREVERMRDRR